jgi:hypothetical protein
MFFEVLSPTYHIPITIECALRGRLPLYSSVFVHTRSVSRATDQRPSAIHDRETRMLSAEASDSGLLSTARRRFSTNDTRVQRSLEPLNTAGPGGCAGADADVFDARVAGRGVVRIHGTAACSPQLGAATNASQGSDPDSACPPSQSRPPFCRDGLVSARLSTVVRRTIARWPILSKI